MHLEFLDNERLLFFSRRCLHIFRINIFCEDKPRDPLTLNCHDPPWLETECLCSLSYPNESPIYRGGVSRLHPLESGHSRVLLCIEEGFFELLLCDGNQPVLSSILPLDQRECPSYVRLGLVRAAGARNEYVSFYKLREPRSSIRRTLEDTERSSYFSPLFDETSGRIVLYSRCSLNILHTSLIS
jgi:hypothetical protein